MAGAAPNTQLWAAIGTQRPRTGCSVIGEQPLVKSTLVYQISVDHGEGETAVSRTNKEPELLTLESNALVEIDLLQGHGVSPTDPSGGSALSIRL